MLPSRQPIEKAQTCVAGLGHCSTDPRPPRPDLAACVAIVLDTLAIKRGLAMGLARGQGSDADNGIITPRVIRKCITTASAIDAAIQSLEAVGV